MSKWFNDSRLFRPYQELRRWSAHTQHAILIVVINYHYFRYNKSIIQCAFMAQQHKVLEIIENCNFATWAAQKIGKSSLNRWLRIKTSFYDISSVALKLARAMNFKTASLHETLQAYTLHSAVINLLLKFSTH